MVYSLLETHETYHKSKVMLDTDLAFLAQTLPPINYLPSTVHMLRRVSGAEDWSSYEQHVCAHEGCQGHVYSRLGREQWAAHKDDCCPHCKSPRFKATVVGGTQTAANSAC